MTIRGLKLGMVAVVGAWLALAPDELQAQKRSRDRITREEILASALVETDLFQVIRSLRPHFLERPRGNRSLQGNSITSAVALYVDDKKDVGLDALRTMAPRSIEEVRYLDAAASIQRYGPMVNGGAVVVKTYKAPEKNFDSKTPR